MYPIYDHFARQGVVSPAGPHPSRYTYPTGRFGPTGEGTSRMGGGDDGDDDDQDTDEFLADTP